MKINPLILILLFLVGMPRLATAQENVQLYHPASFSLLQSQVEVELEREIGEGLLFGGLGDLVLTSEGILMVEDFQKRIIQQFSPTGELMGTIAKSGRGPGEIPEGVSLMMINDTLVVNHLYGILSFYAEAEDGLYEYFTSEHPEQLERHLSLVGGSSTSTYWAYGNPWVEGDDRYLPIPVVIADQNRRILSDSVHILKQPNLAFIRASEGGMPLGHQVYSSRDDLKLFDDSRYLVSRPDSSLLNIYSQDSRLINSISLNLEPRPVTDEDVERRLEAMPSDWRDIVEDHMGEYKPVFLNVYVSDQHILLLLDRSADTQEFMVVSVEGQEIGRFTLPKIDNVRAFQDGRIYTIHNDPDRGDLIRIYNLNI